MSLDFTDKIVKPSPFPPRKRFPQKTPKVIAEIERKKSEAELAELSLVELQVGDW